MNCFANIKNVNEKQYQESGETRNIKYSKYVSDINPKILIAEDVKMNMILITALLSEVIPNAKIIQAYNGNEVIEMYHNEMPDIIFMDVQMPVLDGVKATLKIRDFEKINRKNTPIIALTAGALVEEKERCLKAGMNDFLTKPIQADSIINILNKYFKSPNVSDNSTFNKTEIMERIGNNQELFNQIIEAVKTDFPDLINSIKKALDKSDCKTIKLVAHQAKGLALNLNFVKITDILIEIENESKSNNITKINNLYRQLVKEWNAIKGLL